MDKGAHFMMLAFNRSSRSYSVFNTNSGTQVEVSLKRLISWSNRIANIVVVTSGFAVDGFLPAVDCLPAPSFVSVAADLGYIKELGLLYESGFLYNIGTMMQLTDIYIKGRVYYFDGLGIGYISKCKEGNIRLKPLGTDKQELQTVHIKGEPCDINRFMRIAM